MAGLLVLIGGEVLAGAITAQDDSLLRRAGAVSVVTSRNEVGVGTLALFGLYNASGKDSVTIEHASAIGATPGNLALQVRVTRETDATLDQSTSSIVTLPGPLPFPPGEAGRWHEPSNPLVRLPARTSAAVVIGAASPTTCVSFSGVKLTYRQGTTEQDLDVPVAVNAGC